MLTTTNVRDTYAGNGSTTIFPITFQFQDNSQLAVYTVNNSTLATTVLTAGSEYTVNGGNPGNSITIPSFVATGYTLYISRSTPITQSSFDPINNSAFLAENLESAIDRNVMMIQEIAAGPTTVIVASGGSGSGSVNLVSNANGESGTTGWATYKDTSLTRPTDGTGGTALYATWSTTSTAPLSGNNSFLFSKSANDARGEGVSYDMSLPLQYRAKALTVSVPYIVNSGTFVAGTSSTDSDLIVYFYDITNSKLVEPSSFKFLSNSTTISDSVQATVQFDSTCTSFRLIFYCASTSASAYVLKMDTISVGPANYQYGTPVTDFRSYTPTSAGFGTIASGEFEYARSGDSIFIKGRFTSGTVTASTAQIGLPSGFSVDSAKLNTQKVVGQLYRNGINEDYTVLASGGVTSIGFGGGASRLSLLAGNTLVGSSEIISFLCGPIPILGLSSSVQTSDQTDTRVVAVTLSGSSTSVTSAGVTIVPTSATVDTHGGFSGSTYTVQVPGYYIISATRQTGSVAWTAGDAIQMGYKKNAGSVAANAFVRVQASTTTSYIVSFTSPPAYFNTGDAITFFATDDRTNTTQGFTGSLTRISGPSAIAATETIACSYTSSSGQTLTNGSFTTITYNNKVYDTHGSFSSGTFTCQSPGKYSVMASLSIQVSNGFTVDAFISVYKNGVELIRGPRISLAAAGIGPAGLIAPSFANTISCVSGDLITIQAFISNGANRSLDGTAAYNTMSITKVGN